MNAMPLAARVVMMHQGGWDEIGMVVGPLIVLAVFIVVARKREPEDGEDDDPAS
ncbi:hypothetical protein [Amycolatopsis anabasis]|uniref:hypothetical protein n=1 Tax=Amycolatopsis anabasis TaxID=1840409 RepID=UPI00131DB2F1|nr:hypothetical protein [Amycolatopsis anabasis]